MRSFVISSLLAVGARASLSSPHARCTPSDACWPSARVWATLNSTLGGRLIASVPPAAVCHDARGLFNAGACAVVQANWTNSFWRSDQPGAMEDPFWETGYGQCSVDTPESAPCDQGLVPVYAAAVGSVADVQATVTFAAKNNVRLVVKNTGHDYLGRSSGANSLSVWTHRFKGITFDNHFIPHGCHAPTTAVTVAPGEHWADVYAAADAHNVTVVGGAARSVGAGGGWPLGGGHSALSPRFGLGVDNIVQLTIVTADGLHRTASACSEPDLFWALRGGGGSAFGVLTSVTYKTHPPLTDFVGGTVFVQGATPESQLLLAGRLIGLMANLSDAGWAMYDTLTPTFADGFFVQPSSPYAAQVAAGNNSGIVTAFSSLTEAAGPGDTIQFDFKSFPNWLALFNAFITDVSIGNPIVITGRLLPRAAVNNATTLNALAAFFAANPGTINFVGGGAVSKIAPDSAAVHPAWRNALGSINVGASLLANETATANAAVRTALTAGDLGLGKLIGSNAAYFNEADSLEPDWQEVFWGSHYPRLLAVKRAVDPTGVFTCNRCVGGEVVYTATSF